MNIVCENLQKSYNEKMVLDVDKLHIEKGSLLGVMGPNGSGKTTLLSIIAGLLEQSKGKVLYNYKTINDNIRKEITLVFQYPIMLKKSVEKNIAYPLKLREFTQKQIDDKVNKSLEKVNLLDFKEQRADTLSGGEKQKIALVRSLVFEPKILLLDEPTTNIDPYSMEEIETIIKEVNGKGMTVIIITHNIAQASRLCSHILFMQSGKVLEYGKTKEVIYNPQSKEAKLFIKNSLL